MSVWLHMSHVDKMSQEVALAFPKWGRRHIKEEWRVRELLYEPYWVTSALECSDEPIGACPLRSLTEQAAYIIVINPGLWHSHWTERLMGFWGWREGWWEEGGRNSRDTHLVRQQGRSSAQSHYSHLYQIKLSSTVAFLASSRRPNTWAMMF